jgi:hypothetical protein
MMKIIGKKPARSDREPEAIQEDAGKLVKFMDIYCRAHHAARERTSFNIHEKKTPVLIKKGPELCEECTRLLRHAIVMRALCPLDPKPKCRKCPQHCYRPRYKDEMETVMKYVGPRLMFSK